MKIRIVRDTHADEHPNKKKKPHRGYAFIVFEREKDMRGNTTIDIFLHSAPGVSLANRSKLPSEIVALRLAHLTPPPPFFT